MTERRTDDILSADERDALAAEGQRLDEAQAVELALAIVRWAGAARYRAPSAPVGPCVWVRRGGYAGGTLLARKEPS
jgi:hypothetical protein